MAGLHANLLERKKLMNRIVTLTMNPALDVATVSPHVEPTHKLRCEAAVIHAGGGGVNVARVVHRLGGHVTAVLPVGGPLGAQLVQLLEIDGVAMRTVPIEGDTRESFSVTDAGTGAQYRFVLPGPMLAPAEWQACLEAVVACQSGADLVVASGSLPPGVLPDFYARLAQRLAPSGARLVVDTSGPALAAALEQGVYMIKPSLRELRDLTGQSLHTPQEWCDAAEGILARGKVQVIVLSLGEQGACLFSADGMCTAPPLAVKVVGAIGAGDSFVGAMVWALTHGHSLKEAFRFGVAGGTAALLRGGTQLCEIADVQRLLPQVQLV